MRDATKTYELVVRSRAGDERVRRYTTADRLVPGSVVALRDRYWLVERVASGRVLAVPARYRLTLRHPDGQEEHGAFRRYHPGAPEVGHELTTLEDGAPITWALVERRLARDEAGEPFLEAVAERDFDESESLPDHDRQHALEPEAERLTAAAAALARAEAAGSSVELVGLEPGRAADWDAAAQYLDSLILDEIDDHLLETCGVDPRHDPRDSWLVIVKRRLRDDLAGFRTDVEGDHDLIEEWEFRGGRIFAALGSIDDEADPTSGYGWMCRLVDAGVLGAAGMPRVRKAVLFPW
jgi:hypothetical protein